MTYQIREIKQSEYTLLQNFLYEAIFIPEGVEPPPYSIIRCPELQVYYKEFGLSKDDLGFVAEVEGILVGAAWTRIMKDYGHVEEGMPSIAIAIYKSYRNQGIGTALLKQLLKELKTRGYIGVSLAVQKANYAVTLYKKVGFEVVNETVEEYIMVHYF